jgi:Ca2+-binding EF-hand superfamily protein
VKRMQLLILFVLVGGVALFFSVAPSLTQNSVIITSVPKQGPGAQPGPIVVTTSAPATRSADQRFLKLDRDGDGLLNFNEMTENLRAEKEKWDVNSDGHIDLTEWTAYVDSVMARRPEAPPENNVQPLPEPNRPAPSQFETPTPKSSLRPPFVENPKSKPPTENLIKYPKNMPVWFKDYDEDRDGQIGLYEWQAKKDVLSEFKKYDLNDDGFITVDELIRSGQFTGNTKPPQSIQGLQADVGDYFYFEITGSTRGVVWGTDIYTADSSLAAAAVHAGVVEVGVSRLVKVTILAGQQQYEGSLRNEVTSQHFATFPKSFRVEATK